MRNRDHVTARVLFLAGMLIMLSNFGSPLLAQVKEEKRPTERKGSDHEDTGNAMAGREVFRFETFGNEGFWTDAMRLPQGVKDAKVTPIDALKAGLSVDVEAIDPSLRKDLAAELKTDLSPKNAPLLNDVKTTLTLIEANAVIGVVAKGSSIGRRIDGPAALNLNMGKLLAFAANSRAYHPNLQLEMDGKTIGRASHGFTVDSMKAEVDAYLTNPNFYPVVRNFKRRI